MNRRTLTLALVLMFSCGMAMAQRNAGGPGSKPASAPAIKLPAGYWMIVGGELRTGGQPLTDEQVVKIKDKAEGETAALDTLKKKQEDNKKAADDAKAAGNKEALKKLADEAKTIRADMDKAKDKAKADILAIFTDAQREIWATCDLVNPAKARLNKVTLTDEELTKMRAAAKELAAKLLAAQGDAKAITDLRESYWTSLKEKVLTPEQVKAVDAPASKPHSGK